MRILAVNRFYRPDHSATSQMLTDLAEHLAIEGCDVVVVTSQLGYDGGAPLPSRERLAGVDVRRIWTTRFGRSNLVGRAIDYASFYVSAFVELLRAGRRGDVLIAKTDPPLISVAAAVAANIKGMKLINWCQDLFPETAGALGMKWANGGAGRLLRSLRNWSLRQAKYNVCIHEKMAEHITRENVPRDLIRVLPNWADRDTRPVSNQDNALRKAWGLEDRFVIGYCGNLGRAHMPETMAKLVEATCDIEGLSWLFIGGGAGLERVRRAADGRSNVLFKAYQPRSALSESLSVPDIHLISQDPDCEGLILPSKLYGVRAVGRPVLFLGDADGAIAREVAAFGAGLTLDPGAPRTWQARVEELVSDWRRGAAAEPAPAWREGWSAERALCLWSASLALFEPQTDAITNEIRTISEPMT